jgi:hypothetical protein
MRLSTEEKIKKAVAEASQLPNPTIEYNFDDDLDMDLFEGVNAVFNPKMEKNSAKVIYKFS